MRSPDAAELILVALMLGGRDCQCVRVLPPPPEGLAQPGHALRHVCRAALPFREWIVPVLYPLRHELTLQRVVDGPVPRLSSSTRVGF